MHFGGRATAVGLNSANQELKGHLQIFSPPLINFHFSGKHMSQSIMSIDSLPFIWKQFPSWPRKSSWFRTDPAVQMCCFATKVSLMCIQKWKRCPGVLIFGKFPSSIRFNDSVLLSKSCLSVSFSETFNSSSFIPLAIWKVSVVHSYYMAQIAIMFF